MATQRYSVTRQPIERLLTWIKSGEIAIPEIQRPFVRDATSDIRQIEARGRISYTESFWSGMLPQLMDTSSLNSPYVLAYKAAQVKLGDKGFLACDITVLDLLLNRSDMHHAYPSNYLKKQRLAKSRYNQIVNFVLAPSEINIAIGDKAPEQLNSLPERMLDGQIPTYDVFLQERRKLMAQKIKTWFEVL